MSVKSLHRLLEDVTSIGDSGLVELTDGSIVDYRSCAIQQFTRTQCKDVVGVYVLYDTNKVGLFVGRATSLYTNIKTKLSVLRNGRDSSKEALVWYAENQLRLLWVVIPDQDLCKRVYEGVLKHDALGVQCLNQYRRLEFNGVPETIESVSVAVYKLIHEPTGYFYVGSSGDVKARLALHLSHLRLGRSTCSKLQEYWNTYPRLSEWKLTYEEVTTRKEAFALEQKLLDEWWDSGKLLNTSKTATPQIQNNLTAESIARRTESVRAAMNTEESKAKRSVLAKARFSDPKERERISGDNCTTSRAVFIEGVRYASVRDAHKATGHCMKYIRRYANDPTYSRIRWESETIRVKASDRTGANNPSAKRVTIDGIVYSTMREAAKALQCGESKLRSLMKTYPTRYHFT